MEKIKRLVENDPNLIKVELYNFSAEGMKHLSEALKANTFLTNLNLGHNNIGAEGMKYLSEALKVNTVLTNLNLWNNNIGAEGMKHLSEALKVNTVLTNLDLCNNNIGTEGMTYLSEALKVNTILTNLDLRFNNIDAEGINTINNFLERNKQIKRNVISTMIYIIGIKTTIDKDPLGIGYFSLLPNELIYMIANKIWDTRADKEWLNSVTQMVNTANTI